MFWGETVEAKKELYLECMFPLRLTKATLGSVNDSERHFVKITYSDLFTNEKKTSTICVLQKNKEENVTLDLTFDQGEPITFLSTCTVHLSGYYIPEDEEGEDDDEDSDEEGFTLPPGWDEEDDESFRIEGGEEDDDDDDDEDEDEDEDDDDDEDDDEDGEPKIREVDSDDSEEFNEEASLPADILKQIAAKQKKIADASRKRKEPDSPQEAPQAKKQKTETPKKDQKQQQQQQQQKQQTPGKNEPQQKAQTPAKKQEAPAAATPGKKAETPAKKAETPAKKAETPAKKAETPKAAPTTPTAAAAASASTTPGKKAETPKANKGQVRLPTGLIYEDVQLGNGPEAVPGKNVAVQYVGRLTSNNKVFDKSSGSPFTFRLGNGDVIKGWDQGVKGMKVGGKRKLVIPAELGYGKKGYPPTIPPNASLTFDVTLERIAK